MTISTTIADEAMRNGLVLGRIAYSRPTKLELLPQNDVLPHILELPKLHNGP